MDIKELKKLLTNSTSVLILDNGEPTFVIMDYQVYSKTLGDKDAEREVKINHSSVGNGTEPIVPFPGAGTVNGQVPESNNRPLDAREAEILERLNKEILALKHQIETEEKKEFGLAE